MYVCFEEIDEVNRAFSYAVFTQDTFTMVKYLPQ